jgi:PAS domain S-box-containing protein
MLDITEQKQAEEALRQSEKDYRGLFENAHDAIFVFTPDKEFILDVNPRACEMYGFKRDEFIGMSLEDISKDVPLGKKRIKKTLKKGSFHSFETIHYKKDGSQIFLEINAAVVDYKGQQAILSINRDITDRKRAEEKLRLEKAHLDQLFESAQEGIVMSDKEGKILSVNSEFTRLFGYSREELLGRNVDEQVMPRKEFHKGHSITKKVADGENVNFEAIRQRKDGRLIHVSALASPIVLDGEVVAIYAIYRDITERKLSEEKIKAALRERGVMLREIHHRVKNNMQIISSLLRLQSRQIKNKRILDIFNVGQNRIRSMALIHESLYQSKDLSRINFADYIKRLTTHLFSMYRFGAERVQLKVDVGEVFLDINRAIPCGLIVNELVSNSLKHAFPNGQEGKIVVKMNGNSQGKISLIVKDSGIGFPEDLDFKKTETLGMQLVTDLVAQIDGKIKLMKTQGTEFRVVF